MTELKELNVFDKILEPVFPLTPIFAQRKIRFLYLSLRD